MRVSRGFLQRHHIFSATAANLPGHVLNRTPNTNLREIFTKALYAIEPLIKPDPDTFQNVRSARLLEVSIESICNE